ncbi:amidohydrolase family protein [candidate division KSB1 bacterium]|nr:amidohydrolase family protein [candidate division KSB1 bacterium]
MQSYLQTENHIPLKPAYKVIDAHNHLWGQGKPERIVQTMDNVGVVSLCDMTANARIAFAGGGYQLQPRDIENFFSLYSDKYLGRFYCFTLAEFARPADQPLFADAERFVAESIATLQAHVRRGARGLKVLKELGLSYRDSSGRLIPADDPRLFEIWEEAGRLGVPVLIHQSDPYGFFQPVTPDNEHYESLLKYPSWSFADKKFPRKEILLQQRDNLVRQHPKTIFILPHVANFPENLSYVSRLLEENPNVYIDFSARLDELGRQPYTARTFFLRWQDRIVFGSDMPADLEESEMMYRTYFRFLETFDEGFYAPDYDGTFSRHRWPICGIGLPPETLKKIYHQNIRRLIPDVPGTIYD